MLAIRDIHKKLGARRVLRGVSFEIAEGEACVLKGPNGAGKSTLCEIVAGVLDADRGEVVVDGASIREPRARRAIGYAPSNAVLPDAMLVCEWIDCVGAMRGARRREVDHAIQRWGLAESSSKRLASLSLGQRRRLAIACADLAKPRLLLLDEPTVGLDDEGRALLFSRIEAHVADGGAAMIATHEPILREKRTIELLRLD